jgi:3-hydroxyisobutyrate dehydrogenase
MNKFGIIGLGKMGGAIAQRMTAEGLNVLGWTRSGRTLVGVSSVQDLDTLVAQSETLILSLFDDVDVKNILNELLKFDLHGKQIIDTSTVSPRIMIDCYDKITSKGARAVDAPISGGPELVLSGSCAIFIGGDQSAAVKAKASLASISGRIFHVGPLGTGLVMKVINNSMLQIYVSGLIEMMPLAKMAGLPIETALNILCDGPAGLPLVSDRIPKILGEDESVGFTNNGIAKDNDIFRKVLKNFGLSSPMLEGFDVQKNLAIKLGLLERDPAELIRVAYQNS